MDIILKLLLNFRNVNSRSIFQIPHQLMQANNTKEKSICIFEAVEELREPYCVRSDSDAIIAEMKRLGWHGEVVLYSPDRA